MEYNPDIVGAYRQATGIVYKEGLEKARHKYQQLPSFVEISDKGEHVLQVMPGEGISLQPMLEATIASWAPRGGRIVLATWFPVLSDEPKPFEYPKGGKFVWNTASS